MELGLVRSIDIDQEMQQAYLDYAMSVIVARALPDARDGLKPVHRRILYAMYDMGLRPDGPYKKSARVVGEVLGKYHPHGDVAVYEAMARMAQDFSMRYLLVDGQGNFGSVDGDPPAAMRYTEARMAPLAVHMLSDIQKNTVDFSENFDGSLMEPDVLPAAIPNLLVNGATGIAVGMSTNIPPHNLGEVIDALRYMLDRWDRLDDITVEDLMRFIQGPDFPTGGIILPSSGEEGLASAYGSGRGRVIVQARAHIEELGRGRNRIIVTELPYMTNKSSLIERIAELAREGRLEGLADLRDESDRHGLRIVIEVNKTADPAQVLQDLYKSTPMRSTFGIIMLALVDGEPRLLGLKQALRVYLDHRLSVVRRRSEFELEKARQRAHILEGLRIALQNLDEIISLIRKSPDVDTARARLMKRFHLSEIQAQAILDMPLRRLAALERKKIEEEYKEVLASIKDLESLLKSPRRMREVVSTELLGIKDIFGDRRRTQIIPPGGSPSGEKALLAADLIPAQSVWVSVTQAGLVSRSLEDSSPKTSGREAPRWLARVNTRDTLYLVTETGDAVGLPVHAAPETDNPADGAPFYKISALQEGDKLAALFSLPPKDERPGDWYLATASRQGLVKKTALSELPGVTGRSFPLVRINEDDRLCALLLTQGSSHLLLASANGMAIRFAEEEVRPMGLVAAGVNGIKLQGRDEVIGMQIAPEGGEMLFLTSDGKAKRIPVDQFPVQGRYGQGVLAWKLPRTSQVVAVVAVAPRGGKRKAVTHGRTPAAPEQSSIPQPGEQLILHLEKLAPKALRPDETISQTRAATGKAILELKAGDRVLGVTVPWYSPFSPPREPDSSGNGAQPGRGARAGRPQPTREHTGQEWPASPEEAPTPQKIARMKTSAPTKKGAAKAAAQPGLPGLSVSPGPPPAREKAGRKSAKKTAPAQKASPAPRTRPAPKVEPSPEAGASRQGKASQKPGPAAETAPAAEAPPAKKTPSSGKGAAGKTKSNSTAKAAPAAGKSPARTAKKSPTAGQGKIQSKPSGSRSPKKTGAG